MADGDLFVGFAKGIEGGLRGYQDMQRMQGEDQDREMRRKLMAAQLKAADSEEARKRDEMEVGLLKDGLKVKRDESGGFLRDPEGGLISERIPGFQKQVDPAVQAQRDLNIQLAQQRLAEGKAKAEEAEAKKAFEKTFEGRIGKLPSMEKKRFDDLQTGIKSVQDMKDALDDKENTFSLIGDNKYTAAAREWSEAIGRLQSQGAINKDEEKRFKAMAPTFADSDEIKKLKIRKMSALMANRLKTLGVSASDAGDLGVRPEIFALADGMDDKKRTADIDPERKKALQNMSTEQLLKLKQESQKLKAGM